MAFYIDTRKNNPEKDLAFLLKNCICGHSGNWNELVFLCVGSDRVTGDCLGPYVGHQLSGRNLWGVSIYGTLQKPVHALNLARTRESIHRLHPHALVIAVDASLGQKSTWDT